MNTLKRKRSRDVRQNSREGRQNQGEIGQAFALDLRLRDAHRYGVDPLLSDKDARYAAKCLQRLTIASSKESKVSQWVLLHVKPRKCNQLADDIRKLGFGVWQPQATHKVRIQYTRKYKSVTEDIIPGYFFVRVGDAVDAVFGLGSLRYVFGVLTIGGKPVTVRDSIIEMWKSEIKEASTKKNIDGWKCGDKVRVTSGSLQGFQAVVTSWIQSRDTVFADINILGSIINSEIPLEIVEKSD